MLATEDREVTRLEGFSDAVFALSATLLVVSLEVPRTFAQLLNELQGFVAFTFSFAALILIWAVHNAFFRRYALQDGTTITLNACLLFVVLFYVYPLKFVSSGLAQTLFGVGDRVGTGISSYADLGMLFVLYSLGFLLIFLFVALMYWHAWRRRDRLRLNSRQQAEARFYFRHYLVFVLVATISIACAWTGIGLRFVLPGWIYGLLGPLCWAHARWSVKREPQLKT